MVALEQHVAWIAYFDRNEKQVLRRPCLALELGKCATAIVYVLGETPWELRIYYSCFDTKTTRNLLASATLPVAFACRVGVLFWLWF